MGDFRDGEYPPERRDVPRSESGAPARGLKHGLTALGTAAVVAIYGAGYAATSDAASQLESSEGARPLALDPAPVSVQQVVDSLAAEANDSSPAGIAAPPDSARATPASPEPPAAPTESRPAETPRPAGQPRPAPEGREGEGPAQGPATPPAVAAAPAASTAPPAAPPVRESQWLDGSYTAWGIRTGHGDIEATVEIVEGKIVSAVVSDCQMRWPCSDVRPLIPRIISAQRASVPIVSGATQSSDAFMTAVNEALAMARAAKSAQTQ